jgi:hypothetical protein
VLSIGGKEKLYGAAGVRREPSLLRALAGVIKQVFSFFIALYKAGGAAGERNNV